MNQSKLELPNSVLVDETLTADPDVILGYLTGRLITDLALRIGPGAQIRSGSVIYAGSTIGARLQTGHNVIIREQNTIGDEVSIWNNTVIDYGCVIGNRVKIHCNVYLAQYTILEDDVFIAPGASVANDLHPICTLCMHGPTIKRGARIGVNVTVLPSVVIGEGALIGAGSVVTRDIPPHCLAYGNPARITKSLDELTCPIGLVDHPYFEGQDVKARQERDINRSHA